MRARSIKQPARVVVVAAVLLVLVVGCNGDDGDAAAGRSTTSVPDSPPSFAMVEGSPEAGGPAGVLPVDSDGDGRPELVGQRVR